ncbi:MAG: hypothetical protein IPK11_09875 [Ignavibacteria bacterium]|jgi:hypothetical protein|nr:hypothetical protein [Ignavibacteria bacterium]
MLKTKAHISVLGLALFSCMFWGTSSVYAQKTTEITAILNKFKNYRYSNISIFSFREDDGSIQGLNMLLGPPEPTLTDIAKAAKKKDEVESYVLDPNSLEEKEWKKIIADPSNKAYYKYYSEKVEWERKQFKKAFIVTDRYKRGEPFKVFALLTQKTTESFYGLEQDLDPPSEIYLENALVKTAAPSGSSAATLYDYCKNQVIQENVVNVTSEAQGLDGSTALIRKRYGVTNLVDEDNIQQYLRISEGQPQDYRAGGDELTIGLVDLIRFRHYEMMRDPATGEVIDSTYNKSLPKYGVELKYGLDEINYPSLWSERMTMSVMWQSYKMGIVLPTNGWSALTTDVFNIDRRLTNAGFGAYAGFNFPMKIVNQSGVFDLSTSYVFGDADFRPAPGTRNEFNTTGTAFLPRFHLQGHYSFAINVDENSFFRFKLGGTFYSMENWVKEARENRETGIVDTVVVQNKFDPDEQIGGISGKVEYMALSNTVPWGAGVQFFDGTILTNAWLQVPFNNQFSVKGEARMFRTVSRDPKPWEQASLFFPNLQFIVTF